MAALLRDFSHMGLISYHRAGVATLEARAAIGAPSEQCARQGPTPNEAVVG